MPCEDFWRLLRAGVDVFNTKSLGVETKQRPAAHFLSQEVSDQVSMEWLNQQPTNCCCGMIFDICDVCGLCNEGP